MSVPLAAGRACAWLLSFTVSCGSELAFAVCGSGLAVVACEVACAAGGAVLACVELLMELLMEELSAERRFVFSLVATNRSNLW